MWPEVVKTAPLSEVKVRLNVVPSEPRWPLMVNEYLRYWRAY
jgi:hypothetical protein